MTGLPRDAERLLSVLPVLPVHPVPQWAARSRCLAAMSIRTPAKSAQFSFMECIMRKRVSGRI